MKAFIKKYWKEILLVVLFGVIILLLWLNRNSNQESQRWEDNYYTAIDSVRVIKTKSNNLIYERDNYRLSYDELNKQTQKKIKELENELDKQIKYISKLEGNINIDTLIIKDSIYVSDNITHIVFDYSDDWFKMNGTTRLGQDTTTTINNMNMDVPLTLGLTQDGNKSSIFVKTDNPYVTFSKIEGVDLSNTPKEFKHWRWNVQFGFDFQYGIINKTFDNTPYIETRILYIFKNNMNIGIKAGIESQTNQYKTDVSPYVGVHIGYEIPF